LMLRHFIPLMISVIKITIPHKNIPIPIQNRTIFFVPFFVSYMLH